MILKNIQSEIISAKLGFYSEAQANSEDFIPVPVSLTPWELNVQQWYQVKQYAALLSGLLEKVSADIPWLIENSFEIIGDPSMAGWIAEYLHTNSNHLKAANLALLRHDFILDHTQQWRWVESNPIAAGMGPLNQQWQNILASESSQKNFANNPAIFVQANTLAQAVQVHSARTQHLLFANSAAQPSMVMVVDTNEDNLTDQYLLANAIEQLRIKVFRLTLNQLAAQSTIIGDQLVLNDQLSVNLIYFRDGYNFSLLTHQKELAFRAQLESLDLVICPNLPMQLAGSKWIQHQITQHLVSKPLLSEFKERFNLTRKQVTQLKSIVVPSVAVKHLKPSSQTHLIDQGWILKSQNEGGGNVAIGRTAKTRLDTSSSAGHILMKPIQAQNRNSAVNYLAEHSCHELQETVSELGVFTAGDRHQFAGYLLRTKSAKALEGGVHMGAGMLDTIQLAS